MNITQSLNCTFYVNGFSTYENILIYIQKKKEKFIKRYEKLYSYNIKIG